MYQEISLKFFDEWKSFDDGLIKQKVDVMVYLRFAKITRSVNAIITDYVLYHFILHLNPDFGMIYMKYINK